MTARKKPMPDAPLFADRRARRRHVRPARAILHGRGFTLVELLLAIFILGIGIISVAALFPAGIAQQRQSADDTIGAQVAENAMAIIRSKVKPEMFGWGNLMTSGYSVPGDFGWVRPAFFLGLGPNPPLGAGGFSPREGDIAIFKGQSNWPGATDCKMPWNPDATFFDVQTNSIQFFGNTPPPIVITQRERYFPMASAYSTETAAPKPQYVWDVMFRRFQGRIYAAIFVYRANRSGGEQGTYVVARSPSNPTQSPLPIWVDLPSTSPFSAITPGGADGNINTTLDNAQVPNTAPSSQFDIGSDTFAWQLPGQWLLDQNTNVHRVLSGRRSAADGPVTLIRSVPLLPNIAAFVQPPGTVAGTVRSIFYIPAKDGNGVSLTPVFVTVKEL